MSDKDKTHYRKVFNSPYLSSADITGPTVLTIARVSQDVDKTKKTKDMFNTAYFVERELRPGEALKPMILNATNSKSIAKLYGPFIEDWAGRPITLFATTTKLAGEQVECLRIRPKVAERKKERLSPERFTQALTAIQEGRFHPDRMKEYELSREQQDALNAQIQTA